MNVQQTSVHMVPHAMFCKWCYRVGIIPPVEKMGSFAREKFWLKIAVLD